LIHRWWYRRYGFVFSVAMHFGAQVTSSFIYFISIGQKIKFPEWWGTKRMCPLGPPTETNPSYL
jgi:hypothetical protein